jgi:hypothetical protein
MIDLHQVMKRAGVSNYNEHQKPSRCCWPPYNGQLIQERLPVGRHPSCGSRYKLACGMRVRWEQWCTFDHSPSLVIVEPVLTRLKAGYNQMTLSPPHAWMRAGSENCRSNRYAHTPHTDGGEATNRSATPGIRRSHHHSVSKRD